MILRLAKFDLQRSAREAVHQVQRAKLAPAHERVAGKVHRPQLIGTSRLRRQLKPRSGAAASTPLPTKAQLFLHVQPVHVLVIRFPSLPHQHACQSAISEPAPLRGQLAQPHTQSRVLGPWHITIRPAMDLDQPAGASLRDRHF